MRSWSDTEIGRVPQSFTKYRVEDIAIKMADAPFGSSIKNEDYKERGAVVVQGKNINGRTCNWEDLRFVDEEKYNILPRSQVQIGDLVFPKVGTIGKVGYVTPLIGVDKYLLSTNTMMLRVDPRKAVQDYVYYYFSSQRVQDYIELINANSVQPVFNFTSLKNFPIYLPSLQEQEAIAEILRSLDDKIDLLHQEIQTLEQMAETLYRKWFVEVASNEETPLSEFVLFDPRENVKRNSPYMFFEMKCLSTTSSIIAKGEHRVVASASSFRNLDTLLAKITPCLENGKTGLVMDLSEGEIARGSTEFIVMRAKEGVSPYWVYCLARSEPFREVAIQSMTGTSGRQRVTVDSLRGFKVTTNENLQRRFHEIVEPFFLKTKNNQGQIQTLILLRDTLLTKLMCGEVTTKTTVHAKKKQEDMVV